MSRKLAWRRARPSCAILAGFALLCACTPSAREVPAHLIGEWRTPAPRYADRYVRFDPGGTVRFGRGDESESVGRIESIEPLGAPSDRPDLLVRYVDEEGVDCELSIRRGATDDTLRIGAQSAVVWTREGAP